MLNYILLNAFLIITIILCIALIMLRDKISVSKPLLLVQMASTVFACSAYFYYELSVMGNIYSPLAWMSLGSAVFVCLFFRSVAKEVLGKDKTYHICGKCGEAHTTEFCPAIGDEIDRVMDDIKRRK